MTNINKNTKLFIETEDTVSAVNTLRKEILSAVKGLYGEGFFFSSTILGDSEVWEFTNGEVTVTCTVTENPQIKVHGKYVEDGILLESQSENNWFWVDLVIDMQSDEVRDTLLIQRGDKSWYRV